MKYFVSLVILSASLLTSCSNDNTHKIKAEREQAKKINDSIVNAIYNGWNYSINSLTTNTTNQTNAWENWQSFIQEIKQKPSKSISAYIAKVDNLSRITDELNTSIPEHLNKPQIAVRINNLNTNVRYLNSFISLQVIPIDKVFKVQDYIIADINSINYQIDELIRVQNIPSEKGEQEMIQHIIDTTRLANFNFENKIKQEPEPVPAPTKLNRPNPVNNKINLREPINTRPDRIKQDQ
jgi:hypothetical protein